MSDKSNRSEQDTIVTATAFDGRVRGIAIRSTEMCREMVRIHDLSPMAAAALGRFATGIQMMSTSLKNPDDRITATIQCDGPLEGMTVVCGPDYMIKGYIRQPVVETLEKRPGKLDVGASVGSGTLTVIRDTGRGSPYIGRIALVSGEIGDDLAAYYSISEQIPSAVGVGVRLDGSGILQAGGFTLQLMQDADDELAAHMEARTAEFPEVSWLLEEGFTPRQILDLLFGDPAIQYHSEQPCGYRCDCSRERMERGLIAIGRSELSELADDPDGIELTCHFCNQRYHFTNHQIRTMIAIPDTLFGSEE